MHTTQYNQVRIWSLFVSEHSRYARFHANRSGG